MTILELATVLKAVYDQHGDIDVHFVGPNQDQDPYSVERVDVHEAEEGEYPREFDMPQGYKFVELKN